MCGITGFVRYPEEKADRAVIERMTETLRHRGPDAGGVYVEGPLALGHRRLSIIDTSEAANQPFFNEDRSVAVVFNGEIYNFKQLAGSLRGAGHRFATRSDTEVLVRAWEEFGPSCVERLRGMFAFALFDRRRRRLFLARDRVGKKPLYYATGPTGVAFASEIKALAAGGWVEPALNIEALGEYAAYGNTLGARTIYHNVRRLLPGHFMELPVGGDSAEPRLQRYWDLRIDPDNALPEEE